MTRSEFCIALAELHAGGGDASKRQLETWRALFDINSRQFGEVKDLVLVQDIYMGGLATISTPLTVELKRTDQQWLRIGFNAFGGVVRWCRAPETASFACTSTLNIAVSDEKGQPVVDPPFKGHVMYMDQNLVQHTDSIEDFIVKTPTFAPPPKAVHPPKAGCTCPACLYTTMIGAAGSIGVSP